MECTEGFFWVPFYLYIEHTKLTVFILKKFPFDFLENTDSALEFADDALNFASFQTNIFFLALKLLSLKCTKTI